MSDSVFLYEYIIISQPEKNILTNPVFSGTIIFHRKEFFVMEKKRMKVNMNLVELLYRMGKINTATYKAIKRKLKGDR